MLTRKKTNANSTTLWARLAAMGGLAAMIAGAATIALPVRGAAALADDGAPEKKEKFPPFDKVSEDFRKVVSTADGQPSMYTLYRNDETNQLLAELPRGFDGKKIFVAVSISGGSSYTGWQWSELYCYWRQVNDQLVLMQPELQYQARGQEEIQSSVKRTYSDRVLLSVPIVAMGPGGGPVFDLDHLLVGQSGEFALPVDARLTTIEECKAFPQNLEIEFQGPGPDGRLTKIHYSLSNIPQTDYKPREADARIGYFMTVYKDFAKDSPDGKQFTRYINRWNLKKRDASLALSPPEEPIVFYVEHTVPVKYRRYVRDGILAWNDAFRGIGIDNAMEVRQQDAKTGAYMDLDPEDVRYNFIRWITSETAFAMGPSRANPETGEILDADIIFDDALVRSFIQDYQEMIASLPVETASPETLAWLEAHPHWDPAVCLPGTRDGSAAWSSHVAPSGLPQGEESGVIFRHDDTNPGSLLARVVQKNRRCDLAVGAAHQMNFGRLALQAALFENPEAYSDQDLIDGLPERFIGQVLKYIVSHEVGHTLGLRHNFVASTWKTLEGVNATSGEATVGSVMEYAALNIAQPGETQGDYMSPIIGPYDHWAIQYGYTTDDAQLAEIVKRVAEEGVQYATDEDRSGPDPRVNVWDLGKDPLNYSKRQVQLVQRLREQLLDRAVKEGQSWHPARAAFQMLLYQQANALYNASRYVGGTYIYRDHKGDPNARPPMVPVEATKQREALAFVIENAFSDDAFGLKPELLRYLATDKMNHWGNYAGSPEFPVHQTVMSVQKGVLLGLMNPTTLRRVYDNEFLVGADQDAVTLPELLNTLTEAVWSEMLDGDGKVKGDFTARKPMISSLRRNLQREYLTNLIDLSRINGTYGLPRPVQALSTDWMIRLRDRLDEVLADGSAKKLDDYSRTHLQECRHRLAAAIDAVVTYTGN